MARFQKQPRALDSALESLRSGGMSRRSFVELACAALGASATWAFGPQADAALAQDGGGQGGQGADSQAGESRWSTHCEKRDVMGSPDACDVRLGYIMGPPTMSLSDFLVKANAGSTYNRFDYTLVGVDYVGLTAAFNQGDYDICTLPSNIGPVLYNNRELKNEYRVVSVNNLGVLYVITTATDVASLDDLVGRAVYAYGEAGPPEYTIEALLKKLGKSDLFHVEFKSTPFEILNMLMDVPGTIAILPQPFIALAKLMVTTPIFTPVDITAEWNAAFADTGSQAVTTTTVVNKAFLEEHEQAVIEYLQLAGESVAWSQANMAEAAGRQVELETFLNNDVAYDAMPYISMVNLVGEEMRTALSGYLDEIYRANPAAVGGAVPGEDFYYLPPAGTVESVGLAGSSHTGLAGDGAQGNG